MRSQGSADTSPNSQTARPNRLQTKSRVRIKFHSRQISKVSLDSPALQSPMRTLNGRFRPALPIGNALMRSLSRDREGNSTIAGKGCSISHRAIRPLLEATDISKVHYDNIKQKVLNMALQDEQLLSLPENKVNKLVVRSQDVFELSLWKSYGNIVTLSEDKPQFLKVGSSTYVRVRVECTNKTLPAMIKFTNAPNDTIILYSANRTPTPNIFEISANGNKLLIPKKHQADMTKQFSIRVTILVKQMTCSELIVCFAHYTPKLIFQPTISKSELKNYREYFSIKLHRPRKRFTEDRAGDQQSLLELNKTVISIASQQQLQSLRSLHSSQLQTKIKDAQIKKQEYFKQKEVRLRDSLDKHIKLQRERDLVVKRVHIEAGKLAMIKAWIINNYYFKVILSVKGRLFALKFQQMILKTKDRKAKVVQRLWREVRGRQSTECTDNKTNFMIIKTVLNMKCRQRADEAMCESTRIAGIFFGKSFVPVVSRIGMFNLACYFVGVKNKIKTHIRTKKLLQEQFYSTFEKTRIELSIMEKAQGNLFVSLYYHLIEAADMEDIFDFVFNYNLLSFLQSKSQKIKQCDASRYESLVVERQRAMILRINHIAIFDKLKEYLANHKFYILFEKTQENLANSKFDHMLELSEGKRHKLSRRDSIKLFGKEKKDMNKMAKIQVEKDALLKTLENKELKSIVTSFLGPMADQRLSISYPKKFFMVLMCTMIDHLYHKEAISTNIER